MKSSDFLVPPVILLSTFWIESPIKIKGFKKMLDFDQTHQLSIPNKYDMQKIIH